MANTTEKEFAAFVDRILRLKEEQDEIGAHIKDVYAEMKGAGYDKTAAGALVSELRKRDKDSAKFEEATAILELYRTAYQNAKSSHTHARTRGEQRNEPAAAVETVGDYLREPAATVSGQIIREGDAPHEAIGEARQSAHPDTEFTNAQRPSINDEPSPEAGPQAEASPVGTDAGMLADREGRSEGEAASAGLPTNQQPTPPPVVAEPEAVPPPSASGSTIQLVRKTSKDYRPNCLNPECCASYTFDHCHTCRKAMAAQEAAA